MKPTTELPTISFDVPESAQALFSQGSSPMGWSAISKFLTCPESVRLDLLGIKRISRKVDDGLPNELSAAEFGTLMHAVLAIRIAYSPEVASSWLAESPVAKSLHPIDQEKAQMMLRVYDGDYPIDSEPWDYVGVETTVVTDIEGVLRSARYDKLVRMKRDHALFSLEHKTASRQGSASVASYNPQMLMQQTIWNKNAALVERYGRMQGVWIDQLVKTQTPKCERLGPFMFTRLNEDRMVTVLRSVDREFETMPIAEDGSWPRRKNACWGRFGPCQYIGLCWDNEIGGYAQVK